MRCPAEDRQSTPTTCGIFRRFRFWSSPPEDTARDAEETATREVCLPPFRSLPGLESCPRVRIRSMFCVVRGRCHHYLMQCTRGRSNHVRLLVAGMTIRLQSPLVVLPNHRERAPIAVRRRTHRRWIVVVPGGKGVVSKYSE